MIGLYIAFLLPIILRLRAGESFERGAWHLGKHYKWIDWIAIIWIIFICIVFVLPTFQGGIPFKAGFSWLIFNYTPLMVGGAFLLFGGWYVLSAHKWFKGPIRQGTDEELKQIEAGFEAPGASGGLARRPGVVLGHTAGGLRARPPSGLLRPPRGGRPSRRRARAVFTGGMTSSGVCAVWQRARATLPMSAVETAGAVGCDDDQVGVDVVRRLRDEGRHALVAACESRTSRRSRRCCSSSICRSIFSSSSGSSARAG